MTIDNKNKKVERKKNPIVPVETLTMDSNDSGIRRAEFFQMSCAA